MMRQGARPSATKKPPGMRRGRSLLFSAVCCRAPLRPGRRPVLHQVRAHILALLLAVPAQQQQCALARQSLGQAHLLAHAPNQRNVRRMVPLRGDRPGTRMRTVAIALLVQKAWPLQLRTILCAPGRETSGAAATRAERNRPPSHSAQTASQHLRCTKVSGGAASLASAEYSARGAGDSPAPHACT